VIVVGLVLGIVRRLLVPLATVVVLVGALIWFVAIPLVERQAANAIGRELGSDVDVEAHPKLRLGLLEGELGPADVRADPFRRHGLEISDLEVRVAKADVEVGALRDRDVIVGYDGIAGHARVREAALTAYVRDMLGRAQVRGAAGATVDLDPGQATATLRGVRVPVRASAVPPTGLRIEALGTTDAARTLRRALPDAVELGPLPYDLRLRRVRVTRGALAVSGGRGAGEQRV